MIAVFTSSRSFGVGIRVGSNFRTNREVSAGSKMDLVAGPDCCFDSL